MTLFIGTTKASDLSTAGTSNNPFFAWNNRATRSAATYASSPTADTGGEVENAFDGNTYDSCQLTLTGTSGNISVDLGTAIAISFIGVAAHNLGTVGGAVGACRPQYSTNGGSTWNNCDGITAQTIADDSTFGFYFDTVTAQDWRVVFSNFTISDVLNVGVIYISNPVTLGQRLYQGYTPPITPTNVDMVPELSDGGQMLGSRVVRRYSTTTAEFTHLDPDSDVGSTAWLQFQEAWNNGTPAFWAWRPTKYAADHDLHYAIRNGAPIVPTNSGPKDKMSLSVPMRIFHEGWI